jgi:hypothetical protein
MNTDEIKFLPELLGAKLAREILGIAHNQTWANVRASNPDLTCRLPGMRRPKYRKVVVLRLLQIAMTAPITPPVPIESCQSTT